VKGQGDIGKPLLLPAGVVFTCQNSGACCRSDWLIGVDEASHADLEDVDWARHDPAIPSGPKFHPLPFALPSGETLTFARKPCGECVFLTADTRCAIHAHLGYRRKPQVCKEFPYSFVETPEGVAVGVSFACTAVRAHHGRTLAEQEGEVREVVAGSRRVRRLPDPISLHARLEVTWDEYKALEAAWLDLLARSDLPVPLALIAGSVLVTLAVGLKRSQALAEQAGREPGETLAGGLAALAGERYARVVAIAANARYPKRPSLTYLAPLYTWLEFSQRPMSRFRLVGTLYANFLKFRHGRGAVRDVTGGGSAALERVQPVAFAADGEIDGFLREYWSHVLFRKTLTPMHGVFRGYQTMLALYGFTKWVAKLHAARAGRARCDLTDLKEAVRLVEQRLIIHARFVDLFDVSPFLTALVDRLYRQPAFVRAAVLEPAPRS